jgi:hypothetical protein
VTEGCLLPCWAFRLNPRSSRLGGTVNKTSETRKPVIFTVTNRSLEIRRNLLHNGNKD